MKKETKHYLLTILIVDLIIAAIFVGCILFSLTYRSVPIQYQHLPYADTLEHYLRVEHLGLTIGGVVCIIFADVMLWFQK